MAETTATVKPTTSVQAKKSSNIISLLAPVLCLIAGYVIWRFGLGNPSNFDKFVDSILSNRLNGS